MSPKSAHHRSDAVLDGVVAGVLDRYSTLTGWLPAMPIPIEHIIETVYDLRILWQDIDEQADETILGALVPARKTIVMNERHLDGRLRRMGPTNFTFAHELGHWLFDAVDPAQGELFTDPTPVFCRGADTIERAAIIRERNADRFAARMLLPVQLLDVDELAFLHGDELRSVARGWGVSAQTLEIRIGEVVGDGPGPRSGRLL